MIWKGECVMAAEFWDDLGRKITGAAERIEKKTEEIAEIAKLKKQIYSLERKMERDYAQIGKMVYDRFLEKKEVDEEFLELCEGLAQEEILIDQYNGEIDQLKAK